MHHVFYEVGRSGQCYRNRKSEKLTVRVVVQDCTGTARFTDIMLQGGSVATAWVSHVSEQRYTFDAQEV